MADWNKPTLPDLYADFQDSLKNRDTDTATLFLVDPTNPPNGVIRYNRSLNVFQEWNGTTWVTKIIAIAGGGTGQNVAQGLGTMATQNANNVNITGGTITGLSNLSNNGNQYTGGNYHVAGLLYTGASVINLTDTAGRIYGLDSARFANLSGALLTNLNGSNIATGTVYRDRLGTGATGTGTRVLLDNGTWGLAGGMVEIVHGTSTMGGSNTLPVNITWTGTAPTGPKKISVQINGLPGLNIVTKVLSATQFEIRITSGGPYPGTIVEWTAFHHVSQI